uniref:Myelin-oligodendrocyte glycoprotein-like n=1 Tax=Monodelphis domestica TaxID=13616 RepID=A0A5F8GUB7_MONDO
MEIVSSSGSFLSSFLIFLLLEKHTLASGRSIYFSLAPKGLSSGLSEQFSVIGPTEPIRAWVGRTADLPCYLSPQKNAQSMKVIWFQSLEIVHHYEDGQDKFDNQSPKFQGRTELVKDAISRGNVTLRIWNITAADKGHYKCHFDDGLYQEEAGIELLVSVLGEKRISCWVRTQCTRQQLCAVVTQHSSVKLKRAIFRDWTYRTHPGLGRKNGRPTMLPVSPEKCSSHEGDLVPVSRNSASL